MKPTPPSPVAPAAAPAPPARPGGWRGRRVLLLLIAVCVAPVLASYFAYYVMPPSDRTNYGTLIEPQRPVPTLGAVLVRAETPSPEAIEAEGRRVVVALPEDGQDPLRTLRGRWILLAVDRGGCAAPCAEKLYFSRQVHAMLGRERGRVARALILTDDAPLPQQLLDAHPDLTIVRVAPERLAPLLPPPDGTVADVLYLIDPLHHLMMRFPKSPEPAGVRRDLQKLLRASRIG